MLHLSSHGRKHTIIFKDEKYCDQFRIDVENARNSLRDDKLRQLVALFNFEDDLDYVATESGDERESEKKNKDSGVVGNNVIKEEQEQEGEGGKDDRAKGEQVVACDNSAESNERVVVGVEQGAESGDVTRTLSRPLEGDDEENEHTADDTKVVIEPTTGSPQRQEDAEQVTVKETGNDIKKHELEYGEEGEKVVTVDGNT